MYEVCLIQNSTGNYEVNLILWDSSGYGTSFGKYFGKSLKKAKKVSKEMSGLYNCKLTSKL